jgi:hypothetical protein
MRISLVVLCLALAGLSVGPAVPYAAQAETQTGLRVEEIVVCAAVKDRTPTGVADTFPSDIYGLYCFTRVAGAGDTLAIKHVWYRGETVAAEARLPVRGSPWRTWSYKAMHDDWKGPWKVDVTSPDGSVIASKKFYLR